MGIPVSIPALVGRRVRELREQTGRSQDEMADAARRAGLDWSRGSVASLETGRRGLSAEELLLLPLALVFLDDRHHKLEELLQGDDEVTRPTGTTASTSFLRHLAKGGSALAVGAAERQLAAGMAGTDDRAIAYMAAREAELHAARMLEVEPEQIARVAYRQWSHGLTEEREKRVAERSDRAAPARSLQAIRGHVTRQLIKELRQEIEEGSDGS